MVKGFLPLITLPIFTQFLSPEDYGLLAMAIVYGSFTVGISNYGLLTAFERNFFEYKSFYKKKILLWSSILTVFIFFIFLFSGSIFFEKAIFSFLKIDPPDYFLLYVLIQLGIKNLLQYFYIFYRNLENSKMYAKLNIIEATLTVGFSLILVVHYKLGIIGYVQGNLIGASFLLSFLILKDLINKQISINFDMIKKSLQLGLPLTPRIFFSAMNSQFDRYMIGLLGNLGGLGIYDIGQKIANLGFNFMTSLQQVFAPKIYSLYFNNVKNFSEESGKLLAPYFFISTLVCFILGIFSEEIILILTTPDFYDSTPIILILSMLNLTYFFGKQPQLLLRKKTGLISMISSLSLGINVILNIPLITYYGILGAAWGTFFAGIISSLISFFYSQKYLSINYLKETLLFYLLFQLSIFSILLFWFLETPYNTRIIIKITLVITFIFFGNFFGYLTSKNFQKAKKIIFNAKLFH